MRLSSQTYELCLISYDLRGVLASLSPSKYRLHVQEVTQLLQDDLPAEQDAVVVETAKATD